MATTATTSDRAFVWVCLPGANEPVAAGVLRRRTDQRFWFRYGERYLTRPGAISLYEPNLPLQPGWIEPPDGWEIAPCLRDAAPDAWGRRVILDRLTGRRGWEADTGGLDELTYLLESSSNRVGGLDFQHSSKQFVRRGQDSALDLIYDAAEALEAGDQLSSELRQALLSGTGIGGARPKAFLRAADGTELMAKLGTSSDHYPGVKAEAASIELARAVGITVPRCWVTQSLGRDVLLMERFDRTPGGGRRLVVSGLTMTGLTEIEARYGTYVDILEALRERGTDEHVSRKLFVRVAFNIAVGNTDDHLRNHAAFWDGAHLTLTPAYDLSPSPRSGETANQAIAYSRHGHRESRFVSLVAVAHEYAVDRPSARTIIDEVVGTIRDHWDVAADHAHLSSGERQRLWGRQILNPGTLHDYRGA